VPQGLVASNRRLIMGAPPLAHSAPLPGSEPQLYAAHVTGVVEGARCRAEAMVQFCRDPVLKSGLVDTVVDAATFHDAGKLDPDIQRGLRKGRGAKLLWDHVDAGVAHLQACGSHMAAWMVRAHHSPGLPSKPFHFAKTGKRLRGRRRDERPYDEHRRQIERTDAILPALLQLHESASGPHTPKRSKAKHGLTLRLALSCLVDADHGDTATFDDGWQPPAAAQQRWAERLGALDGYVAGLKDRGGPRDELRRAFYRACREPERDASLMACEGPVGIGKTTAVTAYLLRRAIATEARRLIIVAPFTAILSQTAQRLRDALLLDDAERKHPDRVIAEHHHRADFSDRSSRDLAVLWTAPIILTTAVQFFQTLAAADPSSLRKLHALPGSVVFLDEMHAALPVSGNRAKPSTGEPVETPILPQNWRWLCQLADDWSCSFVLASGSLARFWTVDDIIGDARRVLPDLVPPNLIGPLLQNEAQRVRYVTLPHFTEAKDLMDLVAAEPGPRLLIMNTVQSAAVMACKMRKVGHKVLHLSTALCPKDREAILTIVRERLDPERELAKDWTLVATSLMEAGVDVPFRTCFRERFATTSLVQIGGRGNRNFECPEGATIFDFTIDAVGLLTKHPEAGASAEVLRILFSEGALTGNVDPAKLVTTAMRRELRRRGKPLTDHLAEAERTGNYPDVQSLGRIIDAETALVVVDRDLRDRIASRVRVTHREILGGSVQIWARKIEALALETIPGREGIYWFPHEYEPDFLGYMAGILKLGEMNQRGFAIFD